MGDGGWICDGQRAGSDPLIVSKHPQQDTISGYRYVGIQARGAQEIKYVEMKHFVEGPGGSKTDSRLVNGFRKCSQLK